MAFGSKGRDPVRVQTSGFLNPGVGCSSPSGPTIKNTEMWVFACFFFPEMARTKSNSKRTAIGVLLPGCHFEKPRRLGESFLLEKIGEGGDRFRTNLAISTHLQSHSSLRNDY